MGKTNKNFSLENSTIELIKSLAVKQKRTLSSIVELAIECYYKQSKNNE